MEVTKAGAVWGKGAYSAKESLEDQATPWAYYGQEHSLEGTFYPRGGVCVTQGSGDFALGSK